MTDKEIQLQNILQDIQDRIDLKNRELAATVNQQKVTIDTMLGDARLEKTSLQADIAALNSELDTLTASKESILKDLAGAQKGLADGQQKLLADILDLNKQAEEVELQRKRNGFDLDAIQAREKKLQMDLDKLAADQAAFDALIAEKQTIVSTADQVKADIDALRNAAAERMNQADIYAASTRADADIALRYANDRAAEVEKIKNQNDVDLAAQRLEISADRNANDLDSKNNKRERISLENQKAVLDSDRATLDARAKAIEETGNTLDQRIETSVKQLSQAAEKLENATSIETQAKKLISEADVIRQQADNDVTELKRTNEAKFKEASDALDAAKAAQASADNSMAEAQKLKKEYIERLTASESWTADNQALQEKLRTWELSLRESERRLGEERQLVRLAQHNLAIQKE